MRDTQVRSLGWEYPLEKGKGMAAHSSILAWEIPWTRGAWQAPAHRVAASDTTEATSPRNLMENFFTILTLLEGINQYCKPLIL